MTVLREIKAMPARRIAGRRAEAFVRNPFALLGEDASEVLSEAEFEKARTEGGIGFSTAHFEAMREDAAIVAVRAIITIAIGEEVRSASEDIRTRQALEYLIAEIAKKLRAGRFAYQWQGYEIDSTGDTASQLSELAAILFEWRYPSSQITYAEVFDLSRYSERIDGIGVEKPYYSPYIARKNDETSWVPENIDWGISWTPAGQVEPIHRKRPLIPMIAGMLGG